MYEHVTPKSSISGCALTALDYDRSGLLRAGDKHFFEACVYWWRHIIIGLKLQ